MVLIMFSSHAFQTSHRIVRFKKDPQLKLPVLSMQLIHGTRAKFTIHLILSLNSAEKSWMTRVFTASMKRLLSLTL